MRLSHKNIGPETDPAKRLWIYQSRTLETNEWFDTHCLTELEFLLSYFEVMGFFASQSPKIWFTQKIMVVKFEKENEEWVGMMWTMGER